MMLQIFFVTSMDNDLAIRIKNDEKKLYKFKRKFY